MTLTQQMILANADAITHGVRRITGPARLATDITEDLVADATMALLGKRGELFNPERGNPAGFCRMVAYQVARDALRSMKRGGQFSGAYAGFGNAQLDADRDDDDTPIQLPDNTPNPADMVADRQWLTQARNAVAAVLPSLTAAERALWTELSAGTFNAATHAEREGIATATAHVRANRLRSKVRGLLQRAAA